MTTFASDTFAGTAATELTAHASTSGHTWSYLTGSSGSAPLDGSGHVYDAAFNGPVLRLAASPASADYDVTCDCQTDAGGNYTGGPAGRLSSSAATGYLVYWNGGAAEWRLISRVAGTDTTIGTYAGDTAVATTRTVKLSMVGSTITVYIGGVSRISVTDTTITAAGFPGVYVIGGASTRWNAAWQADQAGGAAPDPAEDDGFDWSSDYDAYVEDGVDMMSTRPVVADALPPTMPPETPLELFWQEHEEFSVEIAESSQTWAQPAGGAALAYNDTWLWFDEDVESAWTDDQVQFTALFASMPVGSDDAVFFADEDLDDLIIDDYTNDVADPGLGGDAVGAGSASGALGHTVPMAAGAAMQATATAALQLLIGLAAAAQGLATASGALAVGKPIAGDANGQAAATGAMTLAVNMAVAAAAQAGATGQLALGVLLTAAAAGLGTASGALTTSGLQTLGSNAAAAGSASGALQLSVAMAGASLGSGAATGALTKVDALNGAAVGLATGSGQISLTLVLAGAALAQATSTGVMNGTVLLGGAAAASAGVSGLLNLSVPLNGSALMQAQASGGLSITVLLGGAATASASAAGGLSVKTQVVLGGAAGVFGTAEAELSVVSQYSFVAKALRMKSLRRNWRMSA